MPEKIQPLVSVIVPTFNNASRIAYTLNSILNQDCKNLEIILVNDASNDGTLKIAEDILENCEKKFKIINHEKNLGVAASRNDGLDAATGELIWFCDGDDLAESNLVSTLADLILKHDCDIAFCGMINKFMDGGSDVCQKINLDEPYVKDSGEMLYLRLVKRKFDHSMGTMYKKSFLKNLNLRFLDGCTAGEDVTFEIEAMCRAGKIAFTPECLYIYVHSSNSGQVRDKDTFEKRLKRYQDFTDGQFHSAEYISRHAKSAKIKSIADNLLLPEALIRRFTIFSRSQDYGAFKSLLSEKGIKKNLLSSVKFLFQKPEVFLKAIAILLLPNLYYKLRQGY